MRRKWERMGRGHPGTAGVAEQKRGEDSRASSAAWQSLLHPEFGRASVADRMHLTKE